MLGYDLLPTAADNNAASASGNDPDDRSRRSVGVGVRFGSKNCAVKWADLYVVFDPRHQN